MFELILSLCLSGADTDIGQRADTCRDVLLPGFEAATAAGCAAQARRRPPDLADFAGYGRDGAPRCVPRGPALDFSEVAPGVFVHRGAIAEPDKGNGGDVANIAFVIGPESVAVIDAGSARWIGEGVWRAVRARSDLPVSHLILTHMHPDHVLGAGVLAETGARVVGHAGLARALADRRQNYLDSLETLIGAQRFIGTDTVAVDMAVTGKAEIDLGGRILDLQAWPVAHTGTDLTVQDRGTGLLFAGDLVFHEHAPALDGSVTGWQAVLGQMADLDATGVVPGHGGPVLDWPEGGAPVLRYLAVLAADTRAAIAAGQRLGDAVQDIARSEAPHWALFDAYNARNATVAFTELEWE